MMRGRWWETDEEEQWAVSQRVVSVVLDPFSRLEYRRGHRDALYLPRLCHSQWETIAAVFYPHIAATQSQKEVNYKKEPDASNHNITHSFLISSGFKRQQRNNILALCFIY